MNRKTKQAILALEIARMIRNVSIGASLIILASFWIFYKTMGV